MRASLMTRAGSVAAAAALVTTGAIATAGAAGASTAHHKRLPTHLSIAKHGAVAHHKHVTIIGGRLSTVHNIGLRGRLVFLERITASHTLVKVSHERTGKHGLAAFVVDPQATTKFVLVFEGTPHLHSSRSHVVVVKG